MNVCNILFTKTLTIYTHSKMTNDEIERKTDRQTDLFTLADI